MKRKNVLHSVIIPSVVLCLICETTALAGILKEPVANISRGKHDARVTDGAVAHRQRTKPEPKRLSHLLGRLVVKLKAGMKPERLQSLRQKHALTISENRLSKHKHPRFKDVYDVSAAVTADLPALAAELKADEAVEYAEPIAVAYTQLVPNDPLYAEQWSHKTTRAESGWNMTTGTASTIIAVVDSGVAYNHPDLAANIWRDAQGNPGKDFVNIITSDYTGAGYQLIAGEDYEVADYNPSDYYGHGTHVAGIIAADGNNGVGVTGVCPGCTIMPLRAGFALRIGEQDWGVLQSDNVADAIIYAADNGAKIINMSFGGPPSQLMKDAIDYADSKGVVLIAAAGNDNISSTEYAYPAAYGTVLAVAATDNYDAKAAYSNYGGWVGVAAPGGDNLDHSILSTVPTSGSLGNPTGYTNLSGTSMAAAYVAGAAGLVLSKNPTMTSHQVMQAIRQGTDVYNVDIPNSPYYVGAGRVNVDKTLRINSVSTATADISSPRADFVSGGLIPFSGSATAPYRVFYGQGIYPASWTEFGAGQAMSGVLATLDSSALASPFDDYTIKLVAEDQYGRMEKIVQGRIGKQFLPGWPQEYSFTGQSRPVWNAPTRADVDSDGFDEIIIPGQDNQFRAIVSVFKKDGTRAEGNWPQTVPGAYSAIDFGVVVGDFKGDGNVGIVASVLGPSPGLFCWDRLGNLLWSKVLEPGIPTLNISLADINGDGILEIITQTYNSKLYVLDYTGAVLWSYFLNEYDSWDNEKTVAVADFDRDGKKEIAKNVITNLKFDPGDSYRTLGGSLIVFNHDGSVRWKHDWPEPGEPLATTYYAIFPTGSPVAGDINNDGKPDIMVKVSAWKGDDTGTREITTRFYAFDNNGAVLPGWPVSVSGYPSFSELALGDLNRDGYPELVGGAGGYVHVLTRRGASLFPPVPVDISSNPVIADITGDGKPDILVNDGSVFNVIQHDGSVSTLPITVRDGLSNVHNTPIATDLDNNGTEDLVFLEWRNHPILWAWNLQIPHAPEAEEFTLFGFDAQHTNHYRPPSLTPPVIATPPSLADGEVGNPYCQTLSAANGKAPYAWAVSKKRLPLGLSLNGKTGVISGTPDKAESRSFTLRVTDARGATATGMFTITIGPALPDLAVTSVSGPSLATRGTPVSVSARVNNLGKGRAASSMLTFYLSTDESITVDDIMLGEKKISSLAGGGEQIVTATITIPPALAARTYYIGAVIDRADSILETNEANNAKQGNSVNVKPN